MCAFSGGRVRAENPGSLTGSVYRKRALGSSYLSSTRSLRATEKEPCIQLGW